MILRFAINNLWEFYSLEICRRYRFKQCKYLMNCPPGLGLGIFDVVLVYVGRPEMNGD